MAKTNQSAQETQGMARQGPSLDLFGNAIEEDRPSAVKTQVIRVFPAAIMPEIPVRPFSVTRINATTVVIWNEP
jgi:hypothetical protein